ncbi:hypothetical protein N0V84_008171 [Fusarium piperis]|uniref:Methyltransferase domain-containing protein n=1 Tax=Fusarium piperis TaxID=1435070 RepID=A0A9W9BMQ6_9HYPO|nr:hypothetical protein N0V84_008171 [Fusarium piperis]
MPEEQEGPETPPLVADDNAVEDAFDDGDSALGDTENERLGIPGLLHHLFLLTFDGRLQAAPLPKKLRRAFDAGCGTGIWAIEFADEHPECEVTGVDLSPIQPTANLNPGGIIELIDIIYPLTSDDGTLAEDSALYKWSTLLSSAFTVNGSPMDSALKYQEQLKDAGFVDVHVVKRKWPLNRWPKDQKHKQIGGGGLGWSNEELEVFLPAVRKDIRNLNIHSYWPM